jgi:hypothetical protein
MNDEAKTELDRKIDLFAKKTEDEWAYAVQAFFETIAPLWFKWLGWVFALGGVSYLAQKTGSVALKGIEAVSYVILAMYFLQFFASIRVEPYHSWALSQKGTVKRFLALLPIVIMTLLLVWGSRELIDHVIEQVKIAK